MTKMNANVKSYVRGWISRLLLAAGFACCSTAGLYAQGIRITGTVSEQGSGPLTGATVVLSGKNTGVTTNNKGYYTITVNSPDDVLEFSYLGCVTQKIKIGRGKTVIDVVLVPETQAVEEVVVIGYGETKRADLTGSVANVKMADVKDAAVLSIDHALQGRVAGTDIMTTSGDPGAGTSIRIRGSRSITASNEPLIVVDGIIDAVQDLSDINSADIESVSILKDASSTAIYGSRGSNGVIIVTTKKGSATTSSKPWVTLRTEMGFSQLARELDVMNASEFAQYRNEITDEAYSYGPTAAQHYLYKKPSSLGEGTDWIDQITRTATYQNYNMSVSGRSPNTAYYGALGYSDTEGIIQNSGVERITGRFNIDHNFSKWFKVGFNTSVSYRKDYNNKAAIGGTNWWNGATYLSPLLGPEDTFNPYYSQGNKFNNPYITLNSNISTTERFSSTNTLTLSLMPVKGLTISSKNTYYLYQLHDYRFYPSTLPTKNEGDGAEAYRAESDTRQLSSDNTVTYKFNSCEGHSFDMMAGFLGSVKTSNLFSLNGKGFLVDDLTWNNMNGIKDKENYKADSYNTKIVKTSVISRINYNYKQRYYLTLTGRADGSSNFAVNHKWAFFPSAAIKWTISNEPWMKYVRAVDELAVRVSAGRTGNDAISAYRSLYALDSSSEGYIFAGQQATMYYPSRLESDNLTWEKTDLYNLAIDLSLFKKRLQITLEGYLSYTRDLLLSVQRPSHTGYTSHLENIGKTSNKGVELTVESRNISRRRFSWSTSFTLSHNRQMVENIGQEDFVAAMMSPGNNTYMMYGYVAGQPLNALWGFKYGGVWHNEEEIERNNTTKAYASATTNVKPGTSRFLDINHDGILDNQDLVYLGNADPDIYGGLQNTFTIGNLRLGVYFAYSLGGKIYNYSEFRMSGSYTSNQYRYMTNAWHAVRNPDSDYPRAGSHEVTVPSNFMVHDASYLRLKTLTLSYTFDLRSKTKYLRDVTLGVSGENLFLWSRYNGFDPDVSTENSGSTLRRVDMGAYPRARTIVFNLQIRY